MAAGKPHRVSAKTSPHASEKIGAIPARLTKSERDYSPERISQTGIDIRERMHRGYVARQPRILRDVIEEVRRYQELPSLGREYHKMGIAEIVNQHSTARLSDRGFSHLESLR